MARAYRGPFARVSSYPVPYATAAVWGTGIDPVHSYYGEGPPLRVIGRDGTTGNSPVATQHPRDREYQQPGMSSGMDPPQEVTWGYPTAVDYSPESFGQGANSALSYIDTGSGNTEFMDDRPAWNEPTEENRIRS